MIGYNFNLLWQLNMIRFYLVYLISYLSLMYFLSVNLFIIILVIHFQNTLIFLLIHLIVNIWIHFIIRVIDMDLTSLKQWNWWAINDLIFNNWHNDTIFRSEFRFLIVCFNSNPAECFCPSILSVFIVFIIINQRILHITSLILLINILFTSFNWIFFVA